MIEYRVLDIYDMRAITQNPRMATFKWSRQLEGDLMDFQEKYGLEFVSAVGPSVIFKSTDEAKLAEFDKIRGTVKTDY